MDAIDQGQQACHIRASRRGQRLAGFFDWDFAGPATPEWDLALAAFSWVPLHARWFAAAEGFTDFTARPRRLDRFLRTYGWPGTAGEFLGVVQARIKAHADGIRDRAASGDEASGRLLRQGVPDALDHAIAELASSSDRDGECRDGVCRYCCYTACG
jgi:aminoglycoside phosphotransferase (APT) family kinase protein